VLPRDAELLEFLVAKKQESLAINVVRNKEVGILAEANAIQPLMQIAHPRSTRQAPPRTAGALEIVKDEYSIVPPFKRKFNTLNTGPAAL
jgi:hypothetical protein